MVVQQDKINPPQTVRKSAMLGVSKRICFSCFVSPCPDPVNPEEFDLPEVMVCYKCHDGGSVAKYECYPAAVKSTNHACLTGCNSNPCNPHPRPGCIPPPCSPVNIAMPPQCCQWCNCFFGSARENCTCQCHYQAPSPKTSLQSGIIPPIQQIHQILQMKAPIPPPCPCTCNNQNSTITAMSYGYPTYPQACCNVQPSTMQIPSSNYCPPACTQIYPHNNYAAPFLHPYTCDPNGITPNNMYYVIYQVKPVPIK